MTTEVKICGLSTTKDIDAAIEGGADYIGLVFFEPSPRNVSIDLGRRLAEHARGRSKIVALTVDADDELLSKIAEAIQPDIVQLHGSTISVQSQLHHGTTFAFDLPKAV